jgi:hypothetical protein
MPRLVFFAAVFGIFVCQQGCQPNSPSESIKPTSTVAPPVATRPVIAPPAKPKDEWKKLFDGRTLAGWKVPKLGGEGRVHVENGAIVLEQGGQMTAIAYTGDVPDNNYEVSLEGRRLEGSDFFCTTTFRVGDKPCTLVVGGWGGSLVGLSNVDGHDASENPTMTQMTFEEKRWYRVRIRVTDAAIEAWIGDRQVVKQPRKDHRFNIRMECDECRPLGICTWSTKGEVRDIQIRRLPK